MKIFLFRNKLSITIIILLLLSATAISSAAPTKTKEPADFNTLELRIKTSTAYIDIPDVVSFSWGLSTESGGAGTGSPSKVITEDLVITKAINDSSTLLANSVSTGKHFDEVTLTLKASSNKGTNSTYNIILENVIITSVSQEGRINGSVFSEQVTFNYQSVKIEYR